METPIKQHVFQFVEMWRGLIDADEPDACQVTAVLVVDGPPAEGEGGQEPPTLVLKCSGRSAIALGRTLIGLGEAAEAAVESCDRELVDQLPSPEGDKAFDLPMCPRGSPDRR